MILVPSIHPAALLRGQDGSNMAKFEQTCIADMRKAKEMQWRRPDWNESVIWSKRGTRLHNLFPTLAEVVAFVQRCYEQGATLVIDVETSGEEPLASRLICIGMATDRGDAICVPILRQFGKPYWTPAEWQTVFTYLRFLFATPRVPKCFHNGSFDTVVLYAHGLPVARWEHDTMQAHHVLDGELPHGLAYCASVELEVPYWKDDVKGDIRWLDLPDVTLRSYNLRDCLTTVRLLPKLLAKLAHWDLLPLYWEEIRCCQIMARATIRGIEVDLQRRDDTSLDETGTPKGLGPRLRKQRAEALKILHQIAGSDAFNPRAPGHLRFLLFDQLKFPVVGKTKSGLPSTDKNAMVLLALNADQPIQRTALQALIDFRQADKMLGTWVEGLPVLGDGRVHPSWKLLPVTGRFSSSPNAQNWNKYIKKIFRSGRGQKFVSVDLSQAEMRFIAYLSGDPELLRMYEQDINVHTVAACLLFQVMPPKPDHKDTNPATNAFIYDAASRLLGLDASQWPAFTGDWKSTRTLAKNFGFGHNYGAEADTLYQVIRSKRDPDTNKLLFPDVSLGDIEAMKIMRETIHPAIPRWWKTICEATQKRGYYRCPISGRIRWFRGGFKRNEMLNFPIQTGISSYMNQRMIEVDERLIAETGGAAQINMQVHDALFIEAPDEFVKISCTILEDVLNEPIDVPGFGTMRLPADKATVGEHLDEV